MLKNEINTSVADQRWSHYPILLVIITIMNNYKTQIETLAQVKQVVRLSFSPAIIMEMQLILLFRIYWHLYCLERQTRTEIEIRQTEIKLQIKKIKMLSHCKSNKCP